jgi:CBS-domain-containing membrane protein
MARRFNMLIEDIMRAPVLTVGPETTMDQVARMLVENDSNCVVVVNHRGHAQGVLTTKDFVPHDPANPFNPELAHRVFGKSILRHGLETIYSESRILTAGKMMRPLRNVLEEDDPVERGVDQMLRHDADVLPVLRGHKAVGTVSRQDLLKVVLHVARPAQTITA